jgi:hypothetical protein
MHTWMFPCFLFTETGLDTHSVKGIGWIKPTLNNFSTSALIAGAFLGLTTLGHFQTRLASR